MLAEEEFVKIQDIVNRYKEMVYSGEMTTGDYYARCMGLFESELSFFFDKHLDSNLDLLRLGGLK